MWGPVSSNIFASQVSSREAHRTRKLWFYSSMASLSRILLTIPAMGEQRHFRARGFCKVLCLNDWRSIPMWYLRFLISVMLTLVFLRYPLVLGEQRNSGVRNSLCQVLYSNDWRAKSICYPCFSIDWLYIIKWYTYLWCTRCSPMTLRKSASCPRYMPIYNCWKAHSCRRSFHRSIHSSAGGLHNHAPSKCGT